MQLYRTQRFGSFTAATVVFAAAVHFAVIPVQAGDLAPPPGTPSPTMKTLDEVEPRVPVQSLSGDASSLYIIDQPGSYYLTNNITVPSGKHGLKIANNPSAVVLDLNGFALIGASGSFHGIAIDSAVANLIVRNGSIREFDGDGIHSYQNSKALIEGLTVYGNGIYGIDASSCSNCLIKDCTLQHNGSWAIRMGGGVIENCAIFQNGAGITALNAVVRGCKVEANSGDGISISGGVVSHCVALANTQWGIAAANATVTGCTVLSNGSGITAFRANIIGNTVTENTGNSITANAARVSGNHVVGGEYGILVDFGYAASRIEANNVANYTLYGIKVDSADNWIAKNTCHSSVGTPYQIAAGNAFGPIVNVGGVGDISGTTGADHPWANFEY
jgi:parallel beta-helix repeat protein